MHSICDCLSRSQCACDNRRTVHGPQPRPGEAKPIEHRCPMQDRSGDEDDGSRPAPGRFVGAASDVRHWRAWQTHVPRRIAGPMKLVCLHASATLRQAWCGTGRWRGRRSTARQKPTTPEGVPTGEQRRNHRPPSSRARRRWRCGRAAARRPQPKKKADARPRRRRPRRKAAPKKKAAGRKKTAAKKVGRKTGSEEEGRAKKGGRKKAAARKKGGWTQEGRCCRGSCSRASMPIERLWIR